jgi:DNA polymerase-3 subunit epsilon
MIKKLLFFDTETTGLNPEQHEIIQFAARVLYYENDIFTIPENSTYTALIRPDFPERADPAAMAVHQYSIADLNGKGKSSYTVYKELLQFFALHINKFDQADKFFPAGFNVEFDYQFLAQFFKRKLDVYFGSWSNHRVFDALHTARMLAFCNIPPFDELQKFKLKNCIDIMPSVSRPELIAHNALSDIDATIELFKYEISLLNLIKMEW